ncbi:MAG: YqgE/AlgH family protein [Bryobacterales bacterium]
MKALFPRLAACLGLALAAAASLPGQLAPDRGRFLVASESLGDPNFYQTVVLMLDYNETGALGLIVNRPTEVRLAELFSNTAALTKRSERVYLGGPVERDKVLLLLRHRGPAKGFEHVLGDLYSGGDMQTLAVLLESDEPPDAVRGYAGYAGWGAGQLDDEIEQGAWLVVKALPEQVFDPKPELLWRRLFDGAQVRFAGLGPSASAR